MAPSPTATAVAQAATTLLTLLARQQAPGADDTGASPDSAAADGNDAEEDACASGNATDKWGLRIGAIFIILVRSSPLSFRQRTKATLGDRRHWKWHRQSAGADPQVTSLLGTVTPIVLRRATVVPRSVWEFAKFFGSGVSEYHPPHPLMIHSIVESEANVPYNLRYVDVD